MKTGNAELTRFVDQDIVKILPIKTVGISAWKLFTI